MDHFKLFPHVNHLTQMMVKKSIQIILDKGKNQENSSLPGVGGKVKKRPFPLREKEDLRPAKEQRRTAGQASTRYDIGRMTQ